MPLCSVREKGQNIPHFPHHPCELVVALLQILFAFFIANGIFNLLLDCVKEFPQDFTVGLEELAFPHNIFKGLFEYRNIIVICILVFAGVALFLLVAQPAQKKKKALMQLLLTGIVRVTR